MNTARRKSPRELLQSARIDPRRVAELELLKLADLRALKSAQMASNNQTRGIRNA